MHDVLIIEAAKMALQIFFTSMKIVGKTTEEIEELYQKEKQAFELNQPENLPDV